MKEFHIKLSELDTSQGLYQAEILPSPPGTEGFDFPANSICQLTLPNPLPSGRTLQDFQKYLLNLKPQEANELQLIGIYLFNFLFGPPCNRNMLYENWEKCYTCASEEARDDDPMGGMRTFLHLTSPLLVGVPWELCNDNGDYLVLLPLPPHALIRSGWKASGIGSLPAAPLPRSRQMEPLRVLLTICHSKDDSKLMGLDEALYVDNALFDQLPWVVDLHILVRPSLQEMQAHCREWEPHILHFVGHGGIANNQPYLLYYEKEQNQGKQLFPADLIALFARTVPRLVILNACRSGQGQPPAAIDTHLNAANAIYNFSQRLVNKGVLAIIAMQADILGDDAAALMCQFYSQLAQGFPIDRALSMARHERHASDPRNWSWTLPTLSLAENVTIEDVLMLYNDDEHKNEPLILPPHSVPDKYENLPLSMSVKIHIGHEEDELQLARQVLERGAAAITLIHGIEDVGKSTILYWLAERCVRRNLKFIYADFGRKTLDYWDVLRLIRDGHLATQKVEGIKLNNRLQPDLDFNLFNYTFNCKCVPGYAAEHPQEPGPDDEISDQAPASILPQTLTELGMIRAGEDIVATITDTFIECLSHVAHPDGLVIFLDHIEKMSSDIMKMIQKYLIGKIPQSAETPIRLVLAVQDPESPQSAPGLPWEELLQIVQANGHRVFPQAFYGFTNEQSRWFARIWARRYFIGCKHDKFLAIKKEMLPNAARQSMQLLAKDVDGYVDERIHYGGLPILPRRFIGDLLNKDNIRDWLFAMQGRVQ